MEHFVKRLDRAYDAINDADYILVGAGAGFSAAAGIEYSGKCFEDNFKDFIEKYGLTDMYSSGFYPFKTLEEKWAYWARHVYMNRYSVGKTELYGQLLELVMDKDYFVLTTNVDHQFWINGFEDDRIFATQGDYGLFQCGEPCHEKLYSNRDFVYKAIENINDCKIPSDLIPKCPVCGKEITLNLRVDNTFVEDEKWGEMYNNYSGYLEHVDEDKNIVFLGDSITDWVNFEDFFPFKITNRGIAGDTTTGVLARLDEIISLKPSKLFILIGTNDISYGSSPEKIAGNIRKIISRVQENSQGTKIYVQSLFPRSDRDFSGIITAINHELENISQELKCVYINLYPLLLSSEGLLDRKFTFDGLHLNGPAVSEWMKFVAPYVNE